MREEKEKKYELDFGEKAAGHETLGGGLDSGAPESLQLVPLST